MGGNEIGDEGVEALCDALRASNVRQLSICLGNAFGGSGLRALAQAFTCLTWLDLCNYEGPMTYETLQALIRGVRNPECRITDIGSYSSQAWFRVLKGHLHCVREARKLLVILSASHVRRVSQASAIRRFPPAMLPSLAELLVRPVE